MAVITLQQRGSGSDTKDFAILPSDVYRMKILKAAVEENRFAEPQKDGTKPQQLVLTWEITQLTEEQIEAAGDAGEDWDKAQVWQRMSLFFDDIKGGGPSRLKAFVEGLREQGYLENFSIDSFDTNDLEGIEQRVNVERYIKGQGENAGKPGNRVVSVLPLKRAGGKKKAAIEVAELPF